MILTPRGDPHIHKHTEIEKIRKARNDIADMPSAQNSNDLLTKQCLLF